MIRLLLSASGRLLATCPPFLVRALCVMVGSSIYLSLRGRRRQALRALHSAFPRKTERQRRAILRESCARLVEMGLFLLASPHFHDRRIRETVRLAPEDAASLKRHISDESTHPTVVLVPHFTLSETLTLLPQVLPYRMATTAVVFRPINQPAVDRWVRETRERFGIKLASRRDGFSSVARCLEGNGIAGVLFDQSAGSSGALITMFDRLASATELPGLLAGRQKAETLVFIPERIGFWRGRLRFKFIQENSPAGITLAAHHWLERYLAESDDHCADWLWLHDRWGTQDKAKRRFQLRNKRNRLAASNAFHGRPETPRETRLWITMPDSPDDCRILLPLLRAIREARPDMGLTLFTNQKSLVELEQSAVAERCLAPPSNRISRLRFFYRLRREYGDVHLVFPESFQADLEAWLAGAPQRFGLHRAGKRRHLLTDPHKPISLPLEATPVQIWSALLNAYGLPEQVIPKRNASNP